LSVSWSKSQLDSTIGVISFCATIIQCLKGPLRQLIAKQTLFNKPINRNKTTFRIDRRTVCACKWLKNYLKHWEGTTSITRLFNPKPTRTIHVDAGTLLVSEEIWGMGAWCLETTEYVSEAWPPRIQKQKSPSG